MPIILSGKTYYRTYEAIEKSGIPRATFFRWIKQKKIANAKQTDHRGWPVWTVKEIQNVKKFSTSVIKVNAGD